MPSSNKKRVFTLWSTAKDEKQEGRIKKNKPPRSLSKGIEKQAVGRRTRKHFHNRARNSGGGGGSAVNELTIKPQNKKKESQLFWNYGAMTA